MIKQNSFSVVPSHVAFIMDGNGRWAKKRLLPRSAGHAQGVKTVDKIVDLCCKSGVSIVSLYVFSSENWKRPQKEINALFSLCGKYFHSVERLIKNDVRLVVSGRKEGLPSDLVEQIFLAEEKTRNCKKMTLNLCLNYGGLNEIVDLVNNAVKEGREITGENLLSNMYQNLPPVDLCVRSGGEMRLSNFMLLQCAYAELYFTDVLWPDFNENELMKCFKAYNERMRKFGAVENEGST